VCERPYDQRKRLFKRHRGGSRRHVLKTCPTSLKTASGLAVQPLDWSRRAAALKAFAALRIWTSSAISTRPSRRARGPRIRREQQPLPRTASHDDARALDSAERRGGAILRRRALAKRRILNCSQLLAHRFFRNQKPQTATPGHKRNLQGFTIFPAVAQNPRAPPKTQCLKSPLWPWRDWLRGVPGAKILRTVISYNFIFTKLSG